MHKGNTTDDVLQAWSHRIDGELESPSASLSFARAWEPSGRGSLSGGLPPPISVSIWRIFSAGAVCGAATVAVLMLVLLVLGGAPHSGDAEEANGPPELAELTGVYGELSRLFPDRSVWVDGTDEKLDIGMSEKVDAYTGMRMVVRVEVQRKSEEGRWSRVWKRDVLTAEDVRVQSGSSEQNEGQLDVWIQPLAAGQWILECHLDLPPPYGIRFRRKTALEADAGGEVMRRMALGDDLRLVQKLVPLPGEDADERKG